MTPIPPTAPPISAERQTALRAKAQELEAALLSEMLAHAGLGDSAGPFSGGSGGKSNSCLSSGRSKRQPRRAPGALASPNRCSRPC